ncbi:hypothetical protein B5180_01970 [Streptomyces sp. BF-3]|nr:hypothetical protein B5180_01970 [Streptomyces sp. BF-3]
MSSVSPQTTQSRRVLEVVISFFVALSVALSAGITAALFKSPGFATVGAGGVSFVAAFTIVLAVFKHLRAED